MKNLDNIDIKRINDYGRYIDLNIPLMFKLSDEDILYLRRKYNNSNIAKERLKNKGNKRNSYKLDNKQLYNNGKYRTKGRIKSNIGIKVIIGGLVVFIVVGSLYFNKSNTHNHMREEQVKEDSIDIMVNSPYDEIIERYDFFMRYTIDKPKLGSSFPVDSLAQVGEMVEDKTEELQGRVSFIRKVCNIYQVNYEVVYDKLAEITNNFMSDDYLNGYIEGVTCKGVEVYANSEEELLVYAIRCMKQLPDNLQVRTDNLYIDNGYQSGDNYCEQIANISQILGVDKCLMYAIVQSECGFDSELFNVNNNPAGIKNTRGDWWDFDTKEEGFLELGMEILKYYRMIGKDPSQLDYDTLSQIRDIHAPLSDGNEQWLDNVIDILAYAKENEAKLFGSIDENNRLSY